MQLLAGHEVPVRGSSFTYHTDPMILAVNAVRCSEDAAYRRGDNCCITVYLCGGTCPSQQPTCSSRNTGTQHYPHLRSGRYQPPSLELAPGDYIYVRCTAVHNTLQLPVHGEVLHIERHVCLIVRQVEDLASKICRRPLQLRVHYRVDVNQVASGSSAKPQQGQRWPRRRWRWFFSPTPHGGIGDAEAAALNGKRVKCVVHASQGRRRQKVATWGTLH
ncbi:hypothetical protein VaNZ11_008260, partial [Volvox africanus]